MLLIMKLCSLIIVPVLGGASPTLYAEDPPKPVGTHGIVGILENPKMVNRLEITKPGV